MPNARPGSSDEPLLDLPEEEDSMSSEALENQVQKAQEALVQLKRQPAPLSGFLNISGLRS